MENRGPDDQSYSEIQSKYGKVYLLHSRLSIIDLDTRSNQPLSIDGCTITFNGEIYNYIVRFIFGTFELYSENF